MYSYFYLFLLWFLISCFFSISWKNLLVINAFDPYTSRPYKYVWAYRDLTQQGCKSFCYVWFLALLECVCCSSRNSRAIEELLSHSRMTQKSKFKLIKVEVIIFYKKEKNSFRFLKKERKDIITFTNSSGKSHLQYYNLTFAAFSSCFII